MNKKVSVLLRTLAFAVFMPVLSFGLLSCEPENGLGDDMSDEPSENTTDITITGLVDMCGCTYAYINGYANLNLIPADTSNSAFGVQLMEAETEGKVETFEAFSSSLDGNVFMVMFSNLSPATKYKYRSFVTCNDITYYGNYSTFDTKEVLNITTTGDISEITHNYAVVNLQVDTIAIDYKEDISVGVVYAISRSDIHPDSVFGSYEVLFDSIANVEYTITLDDLIEETTYYYASFTKLGDTCTFSTVKEFETKSFVHKPADAVDLGLSVKWASWNIGAESSEEYGGYYAWGETEEKTIYDWSTYKWCNGSYNSLTKYCTNSYYGTVDNKVILDSEDDIANVLWGEGWRMPTLDEIQELINKCTWEWTSVNGVEGYKVEGKNEYKENYIFLPAAGFRTGNYVVVDRGESANYWSKMIDSNDVSCISYSLFFNDEGNHVNGYYNRHHGHVIRPVKE